MGRVNRSSPSSRATPSSRSAEPNQQGNTCRGTAVGYLAVLRLVPSSEASKPFVTHQRLGRRHKIHKAFTQAAGSSCSSSSARVGGSIHLVDKYKGRDVYRRSSCHRVSGAWLCTPPWPLADHQHSIVQHLQGALGLGGKIHMAGVSSRVIWGLPGLKPVLKKR